MESASPSRRSTGIRIADLTAVHWWQVAALFGAALAKRAEVAQIFAYSNTAQEMKVGPSSALIRGLASLTDWRGALQGTQTMDVLHSTLKRHDRVVILTDEQAFASDKDPSEVLLAPPSGARP